MENWNKMDWLAMILVLVGGLNWGLVGIFRFDLVQALLGWLPILATIVYGLVGLSALYLTYAVTKT